MRKSYFWSKETLDFISPIDFGELREAEERIEKATNELKEEELEKKKERGLI